MLQWTGIAWGLPLTKHYNGNPLITMCKAMGIREKMGEIAHWWSFFWVSSNWMLPPPLNFLFADKITKVTSKNYDDNLESSEEVVKEGFIVKLFHDEPLVSNIIIPYPAKLAWKKLSRLYLDDNKISRSNCSRQDLHANLLTLLPPLPFRKFSSSRLMDELFKRFENFRRVAILFVVLGENHA